MTDEIAETVVDAGRGDFFGIIAVDDGEVDVDRLEQAARIANIHDYIMSLPLKYNTLIGRDGIGLSQGQKQRILIARTVYKQPSFIFLDEATNALDAKNERAIVENLDTFCSGCPSPEYGKECRPNCGIRQR